ncbi:MAG: WD40 repeat domain-containing protein, partial [Hyphomicrobium sp.]
VLDLAADKAESFIKSAVADTAAEARKVAKASEDDLKRLVIPRLATWDPQAAVEGAAKRLVARAEDLLADKRIALKSLADALVDKRLLTVSRSRTGADGKSATIYEVAHEALLRVEPLASLIHDRREKFELMRMLEIEARDWSGAGESVERLGRTGERLREGQTLLADEDFGSALPAGVAPYLAACAAKEKQERARQRRLIGRSFVKPAEQAITLGEIEHSLRLATAGALLSQDIELELVPDLWRPIIQSIEINRTLCVLLGHSAAVIQCAFSADAQRLVTGSTDHTARVWDPQSGALLFTLRSHTGYVNTVSFSPDGKLIVTGSHDKTACIWAPETGSLLHTLSGHSGAVLDACFSPDAKRLVTGSDDATACLWDAKTGAEIATMRGHSDKVGAVAFSPDGQRVATGSYDHTARLWNSESGVETAVLRGHGGAVFRVAFSPDGKCVATGSNDNTIRIWDVVRGTEIAILIAHKKYITALVYSSDGKRLATGSADNTVRIWDACNYTELACLKAHTGVVASVIFSADARRLVTASHDCTARLWDADSGNLIANLIAHNDWVLAASFSPDGKRVATASADNTGRVWDANSGPSMSALKSFTSGKTTFSADGSRVATISADNLVSIWDVESGTRLTAFKAHAESVLFASFAFDGTSILTGSTDGTVLVWDAKTGTQLSKIPVHRNSESSLALYTHSELEVAKAKFHKSVARKLLAGSHSSDGRQILTFSSDNTIRAWDVQSGIEVAARSVQTGSVTFASFSRDCKYLAVVD